MSPYVMCNKIYTGKSFLIEKKGLLPSVGDKRIGTFTNYTPKHAYYIYCFLFQKSEPGMSILILSIRPDGDDDGDGSS